MELDSTSLAGNHQSSGADTYTTYPMTVGFDEERAQRFQYRLMLFNSVNRVALKLNRSKVTIRFLEWLLETIFR